MEETTRASLERTAGGGCPHMSIFLIKPLPLPGRLPKLPLRCRTFERNHFRRPQHWSPQDVTRRLDALGLLSLPSSPTRRRSGQWRIIRANWKWNSKTSFTRANSKAKMRRAQGEGGARPRGKLSGPLWGGGGGDVRTRTRANKQRN